MDVMAYSKSSLPSVAGSILTVSKSTGTPAYLQKEKNAQASFRKKHYI
jgi:hypothetical protein